MFNEIGRKIYYDKITGNVLVDTGERSGSVVATTLEQDFATYEALHGRVPSTIDSIVLYYGQYGEDFAQCSGYRVNIVSGELEFTYPNPNDPQEPPVYRNPLTQDVEELKAENADLKTRVSDIEMFVADMIGGV